MPASAIDGPFFTYGSMAALTAAMGGYALPDPNTDAGPNAEYQGSSLLDPRYWYNKDQVTGYGGKVPAHFQMPYLRSVSQIPAATATNNIAAAQGVTTGVAMTLAARSVGVERNIPIFPFAASGINNLISPATAPTTAAIALDFGFAWATVVSGSLTLTVSTSELFSPGMPLVIAGVGNAAGTAPLFTNVNAIVDATHITIFNAPLASLNPAAIGTGNIWGPSEVFTGSNMLPTAALPFLGAGPGLFLDPRQAVARGVQIVGSGGGTGGTFTVAGWDIYNVPMTTTVTVGAGASTGNSLKAFKYIASVTPNFTDAGHNYTVGTTDLYGIHYRSLIWDDMDVTWNNSFMSSNTGFVAAVTTSPATALTGDVRGTIQTSATGPGSGIGATVSNGTVSSLAMSGVRLTIAQTINLFNSVAANPANAATLFGVTQV